MSVKPIEKMDDAELDAELRKYGVDPEKLVDNFISKLAAVVRAQVGQITALSALCKQQHEALEFINKRCAIYGPADAARAKIMAVSEKFGALFSKTGGAK